MDSGYNHHVQQRSWFSNDNYAAYNAGNADVFERIKASASYGIAAIHYEIILPLKGKFFWLTLEQRINLGFYNSHKQLCSEIGKVEFVFWQYTYAQTHVREATTLEESTKARMREVATGKELVEKYDALIQFAIDQADTVNETEYLDKNEYLDDLHQVLEGQKNCKIYNTVNMIRAKAGFEADLNIQDLDARKEAVKKKYLSVVTELVSNVRDAQIKAGNSSPYSGTSAVLYGKEHPSLHVTNAFIKGLADISELEQGLTIIELYDELTNQQAQDATEAQDEVIQHFQEKIEDLMNQDQEITSADLQEIQFKGISLMSVLKPSGVKQLNDLKALKESLQVNLADIKGFESIIEVNKQMIARPANYSFNDVQMFLSDLADENRIKIENIPKDDTVLGRLATLYTEAFVEHADLTDQIQRATEEQAQATTARTQAITTMRNELVTAQGEMKHLAQKMEVNKTALDNKTEELRVLQEGIAEREIKLASEKEGSDPTQKKLNKMIIDGFKQSTAALVQSMEAEFDDLNNLFSGMFDAWSIQNERSIELKKNLVALKEANDLQNQAGALLLQGLNERLEDVKRREIAKLSGEDVKALARHFGIEGKSASQSSLALHLNMVLDAEAGVKNSEDSLPGFTSKAEEIQQQVDDLNGAMFSEARKSAIADQLGSNLDIAKHVTMIIGKRFAALQDAASLKMLALGKKAALPLAEMERASVPRKTDLQRELTIREDRDANKYGIANELNELVKNGLERFESGAEPIQWKTFSVIDRSLLVDAASTKEVEIAEKVFEVEPEEDSDREPEKARV